MAPSPCNIRWSLGCQRSPLSTRWSVGHVLVRFQLKLQEKWENPLFHLTVALQNCCTRLHFMQQVCQQANPKSPNLNCLMVSWPPRSYKTLCLEFFCMNETMLIAYRKSDVWRLFVWIYFGPFHFSGRCRSKRRIIANCNTAICSPFWTRLRILLGFDCGKAWLRSTVDGFTGMPRCGLGRSNSTWLRCPNFLNEKWSTQTHPKCDLERHRLI